MIMSNSQLRWHLRNRFDGDHDEIAVDGDGRPCFLIEKTASGWLLCVPILFKVEPLPCECIDWECAWECDSLEQARKEAEVRYANRGAYTLSY